MSGTGHLGSPIHVDVLIPVYNEAENIRATLDSLVKGVKAITWLEAIYRVYVIYDDERDTTLAALDAIPYAFPFEIVRLKNPNRGVLGALKEGFVRAQGDFQIVTMADLSDDYTSLDGMIRKALEGADVVCASRYMPGGRTHGGPVFKKFLSRMAGLSLHFAVGLPTRDVTNSFKLYRRTRVAGMTIQSQGGFEIAMEITVKTFLAGGRIAEVPTQWWDRTAGKSRFRLWHWLPKYLRWYGLALTGKRWPPSPEVRI